MNEEQFYPCPSPAYITDAERLGRAEEHRQRFALDDNSVDDTPFTTRTYNCLTRMGIKTMNELSGYTERDLMGIRNFGPACLAEVKYFLERKNLSLKKP